MINCSKLYSFFAVIIAVIFAILLVQLVVKVVVTINPNPTHNPKSWTADSVVDFENNQSALNFTLKEHLSCPPRIRLMLVFAPFSDSSQGVTIVWHSIPVPCKLRSGVHSE